MEKLNSEGITMITGISGTKYQEFLKFIQNAKLLQQYKIEIPY